METTISGGCDVDGRTSGSLVDNVLSVAVTSLVGTTIDDVVVVFVGINTGAVAVVVK